MKIVYGLLLSMMLGSALHAESILCKYEENGYDDETILLVMNRSFHVAAINYTSYQGYVGPFYKTAMNTFQYTTDVLLLTHTAVVDDNYRTVILTTTYKSDGSLVSEPQVFKCE